MEQPTVQAVTSRTAWSFVHRFLWLGLLIAMIVSSALAAYNTFRASALDRAEAALNSSGPSADRHNSLALAFECVKTPHIFGGWRVARRIIPDEPAFVGVSEAQLFEAVKKDPNPEQTSSVTGGTLRLSGCNGDISCMWRTMVKGETTMPRVHLWFYLRLRYALLTAGELEPAAVRLFTHYPSLFVAAVTAQVATGQYTFGEGTDVPLRALVDNLRIAVRNTWLFLGFGSVVIIIFLLTLAAWRRVPWRIDS